MTVFGSKGLMERGFWRTYQQPISFKNGTYLLT